MENITEKAANVFLTISGGFLLVKILGDTTAPINKPLQATAEAALKFGGALPVKLVEIQGSLASKIGLSSSRCLHSSQAFSPPSLRVATEAEALARSVIQVIKPRLEKLLQVRAIR